MVPETWRRNQRSPPIIYSDGYPSYVTAMQGREHCMYSVWMEIDMFYVYRILTVYMSGDGYFLYCMLRKNTVIFYDINIYQMS